MSGLLSGYMRRVVARSGLAADASNLTQYEVGFDTDTKVFRVGDSTGLPTRSMTDKSTGTFSFASVGQLTIGGVAMHAGALDGVSPAALNATGGYLYFKDGEFGTSEFDSEDGSVSFVNAGGTETGPLNMQLVASVVDSALGIDDLPFVKKAGDTMTGALALPSPVVKGAAAAKRRFGFKTNTLQRWADCTNESAETGSNSGSDWQTDRHADSGALIDAPLRVSRSNGMVYLAHGIIMPDGKPWTKGAVLPPDALGYLYNDGDGNLSWRITAGIAVAPSVIDGAVKNIAYSVNFTASGGVGPYTYAVTAGSIPPGMSLTAAGTFSGTPSSVANYTFTVTATDSLSATGARSYTLNVVDHAGSYTITPSSLPVAQQGRAYTGVTLLPSGTYTDPVTFTVITGSLPAGITLGNNGTFSGSPTTAGSYNFVAQATDAGGVKASVAYTLEVVANQFVFVIDHDIDNLNLTAFAGSPTYSGDFVFIINTGVHIRSTGSGIPALRTGVLPPPSTMKIINNGNVHGMGGAGGDAFSDAGGTPWNAPNGAGGNGTDAILLDMPATIDNTYGRIYGGGGGGGGGAGESGWYYPDGNPTSGTVSYYFGGGGGGGGQGAYTATGGSSNGSMPGQPGGIGSPNAPGLGGSPASIAGYTYIGTAPQGGGNGGAWGQDGGAGSPGPGLSSVPLGLGGYAVRDSGFELTWMGGNNTNQVKGTVG